MRHQMIAIGTVDEPFEWAEESAVLCVIGDSKYIPLVLLALRDEDEDEPIFINVSVIIRVLSLLLSRGEDICDFGLGPCPQPKTDEDMGIYNPFQDGPLSSSVLGRGRENFCHHSLRTSVL